LGGEEIKMALHNLVSKIWEEEVIPQEWKYGVINPIHKKGDTVLCENYRAITLLCTAYKILANVLYSRLRPYAEEIIGEYQGVFRSGRSTTDQIFTMRQILKNCWEQNIETHHLFVDFKSAYDSVWKEKE
jgi:sorting nexin-29